MDETDLPGKRWDTADGVHLDLRGLDPPEPMVAILTTLDAPGENGPVTAILSRDPIFLFPELDERGWKYQYLSSEGAEVRLRLTRA